MTNMGRHVIRSCKCRPCRNGAQEAALSDMLGHFRDLHDAGLQQRVEAWNRQGVCLGCADQANELKAVRDVIFVDKPANDNPQRAGCRRLPTMLSPTSRKTSDMAA